MFANPSRKMDRGQIVLILVLITLIGLTVGLSLISRTITDVKISSQIEQSGRAFSAAEAGIESALYGSTGGEQSGSLEFDGASATYTVESSSVSSLDFPQTDTGESQIIWLANHLEDGSLDESVPFFPVTTPIDICWGTQGEDYGAMVISAYYKDAGEYSVAKGAYDGIAGRDSNGFQLADIGSNFCNNTYPLKKTISPASDLSIPATAILLFMRLTPVYEATPIGAVTTGTFPVQGQLITSVGRTGTGVVRKIQVNKGYSALPYIIDFTYFVGS